MSKSMWIDAVDCKPVKDNELPQFSVDVLLWVKGQDQPSWGFYDYGSDIWSVYGGNDYQQSKIEYFAYIDNPYK